MRQRGPAESLLILQPEHGGARRADGGRVGGGAQPDRGARDDGQFPEREHAAADHGDQPSPIQSSPVQRVILRIRHVLG